ncbi:tetratricopeptide repeat protein [bacterium]|nr:tetratricopeptide repeat protein [bacterium]
MTPENLARADSARLTASLTALDHVDSAEKVADLTQLLAAYKGDFLADFHLPDAPAFDQWALTVREQNHSRVVAAYRDLGDYLLSAGEVDQGVDVARHWLQVDRLDEAAHKLLIQFLLKTGNRAVAVAQYEECVALLRTELDTEPEAELTALEVEIDNLRAAWRTGQAQWLIEPLTAALTPLSIYYQLRGLSHEAETAMQGVVEAASTWGADGAALATNAELERVRFLNRLGRYRPVIETVQVALQTVAHTHDQWAEAMGHILWGESLWRLGEYDVATERFAHALRIGHDIESTLIIGWCHHHLGIVNDIQSRYKVALDHLRQACDAWRMDNNAQILSNSLNSMALVYYHQGDLPNAQQAMEQALVLCNQIDNRHLQSLQLNNLSILATEQADYLSAYHYLQIALDLATANGNRTSQGEIYTNLAKNYFQRGQAAPAAENAAQGLQSAGAMAGPVTPAKEVAQESVPSDTESTVCFDAVQGQIVWNYEGTTSWDPANVNDLCSGAESSVEPALCFEQVMFGGVNYGGGTQWGWNNAINLCRGTTNAESTIQCFVSAVEAGTGWQDAITSCQQ